MRMVRWLIVGAAAIVGCLGAAPATGDSPADGARTWLEALAAERDDLRARTCETQQPALDLGRGWQTAFPGLDGDDGGIPALDPARLSFAVIEQTEHRAEVRVLGQAGGTMRIVNERWIMTNAFGHWTWCGSAGPRSSP